MSRPTETASVAIEAILASSRELERSALAARAGGPADEEGLAAFEAAFDLVGAYVTAAYESVLKLGDESGARPAIAALDEALDCMRAAQRTLTSR